MVITGRASDAQKKSQGVILSDLGPICGSNVGSHGKFCTKPRSDCRTANHTPTDREDGLYVVVGTNRCLVTERVLMRDVQPHEAAIRDLQTRDLCKDHWLSVIATLNDVSGLADEAGRDEAVDTFLALVESLFERYPRTGDASANWKGTHLRFSPMKRTLGDVVGDGLAQIKGELKVEEHDLQGTIATLKKDFDSSIAGIHLDMRTQQATTGTPGPEDPPLATTLRSVSRHVEEARKAITELGKDHEASNATVAGLVVKVAKHDKEIKGARASSSKVAGFENDITSALSFCGLLMDRVEGIEEKAKAPPAAVSHGSVKPGVLDARVAKLEKEIKAPSSIQEAISIDNGRWRFKGADDVEEWVIQGGVDATKPLIFEVGSLVADPCFVWSQANSDGVVTREEFQAEEVHQAKTARTPLSSLLASAGQSVYPASLMGSRSSTGLGAGGTMSKISAYDMFNRGDGTSGVYDTTLKALAQLRTVETIRINDDLRDFPELRRLALFMFEYSVGFLIDLLRWVDTNYNNMLVNMSVTNKEEKAICWKLQLVMFRTVWEVLWEERLTAKHAHSLPAFRGLVTSFHASLKTHVVMGEFKKFMFSEHPRIFPKLMTFVFESHTPRVEHLALKQSLAVATDKINSLQRDKDNILRRLAALESPNGNGGGGGGGGGGGRWNKKKKGEGDDE